MNQKYNYYGIYSIVGLFVVLGVALGFDFLMDFLRRRNGQTFSLTFVVLGAYPLTALFLAAISLLLFWFVLNRAPRNVWIALLYLIIGLFISLYPILYFTPAFGGLFYQFPRLNNILLTPLSYIFSAASFIAITGLFALILPRKKINDPGRFAARNGAA